MNDYEKIKNLELSSYKSIGELNEESTVATSDLSNAMSAICYNLSNMLDKRDENSVVSGNVEISETLSVLSDITTFSDIYAFRHGLVGKDVDFSTGGEEVLVVGHEHKIYGKESFIAGNEGNILGAKAFHWKAIDTTSNLIYLTSKQTDFNSDYISSQLFLSGSAGNFVSFDEYKKYDIPYFGPRSGSYLSDENDPECLFTPDSNLSILKTNVTVGTETIQGAKDKALLLNNVLNEPYMRKLTVLSVIDGSVLSVKGLENLSDEDKQTHYRKNVTDQKYHPNHYIVCFPDAPLISTLTDSGWEKDMTFGCAALGEANNTIGYNSFAIGKDNKTEGNYSIALGVNARARSNNSFAWSGNGAYNVSSEGQFGINPNGGVEGFYIGNQNLCSIISNGINAAKGHADSAVNELKSKISSAISTITTNPLSSLDANSGIENAISAIVDIRNILSGLYDAMK